MKRSNHYFPIPGRVFLQVKMKGVSLIVLSVCLCAATAAPQIKVKDEENMLGLQRPFRPQFLPSFFQNPGFTLPPPPPHPLQFYDFDINFQIDLGLSEFELKILAGLIKDLRASSEGVSQDDEQYRLDENDEN